MKSSQYARAVKLWHDGLGLKQIAFQIGVSYNTASRALSSLPREWITQREAASLLEMCHTTVRKLTKQQELRISPGGLYNCNEVASYKSELLSRKCGYPKCRKSINCTDLDRVYCDQHSQLLAKSQGKLQDPERARLWHLRTVATSSYIKQGFSREDARKLAARDVPYPTPPLRVPWSRLDTYLEGTTPLSPMSRKERMPYYDLRRRKVKSHINAGLSRSQARALAVLQVPYPWEARSS